MGLLIANAKDILINIAVYAILFNIIYSILFIQYYFRVLNIQKL